MAALITGASGFIGWHLARALRDRGERVVGLVRASSKVEQLQPLGVELVQGDVTDLPSLQAASRDVDVVYHLAGLTKALRREQLDAVNAVGSANVARACAENGVATLVCVSSLAAAGPSPDGQPVREAMRPQPVSDYGRSKLAGERAVVRYADRVEISVVRPPIVIGEYDPAVLEMFKSIYRVRMHVLPGMGRRPFSLIHAADLVELLIKVAERGERLTGSERDVGHGVYFADAEHRPTYGEIGDLIGASINRRFLKLPMGPLALRAFGLLADVAARTTGRSRYFSSDKVREATSGPWICSAQKAHQQLDFAPQRSLQERFEQTGRWYLEHGWL